MICKRKTTDKIVVKIIAVIWQMTAVVTAMMVLRTLGGIT